MARTPPGMTSNDLRIARALREFSETFDIHSDEVRAWYLASNDRRGLVEYAEQRVADDRAWRQSVADDRRAALRSESIPF